MAFAIYRNSTQVRRLVVVLGGTCICCTPPGAPVPRVGGVINWPSFLDGCFWHGCPDHHTVAATNAKYWSDKVAENTSRDRDTDQRLNEAGWVSVRIWEHEDPRDAALRVRDVVTGRLPVR